jgi:hypothetical protein
MREAIKPFLFFFVSLLMTKFSGCGVAILFLPVSLNYLKNNNSETFSNAKTFIVVFPNLIIILNILTYG